MTHAYQISQSGYAFYRDGTESGSVIIGSEDTNITFGAETTFQLRVQLDETGGVDGASTDDFQLQYNYNSGGYTNVTGSSTEVQAVAGSLTDGGATTQRLTAGAGSAGFDAGEQEEANGVVEDNQQLADTYTEHVWSLKLVGGAVTHGHAITFRVLLNGATTNVTYTVTPQVTVGLNRYQVAAGTWDESTESLWAHTSGGTPSNACPVPNLYDNVFFDANSNTGTTTFNPSASGMDAANSLDFTGFTGTLDGAANKEMRVAGNLTSVSGMTWASTGDWTINFFGSSGTQTLTPGSGLEGGISIQGGSQGASLTLAGALTCFNFIWQGTVGTTLTWGAFTHSFNGFTCTSSVATTINLSGATLNITRGWNMQNSGPSVTAGTSTINVSNASGSATAFEGGPGGLTYDNVTVGTGSSNPFTFRDSSTFDTLTISAKSGGRTVNFEDGTTQTVTSFVSTATTGNVTTLTGTSTGGWTISDSAGTNSVEYNTISYSTAQGGATWNALTNAGNVDGGNNTGWTFGSSWYWILTAGGTWDETQGSKWSATSGGAAIGGSNVPTSVDNVFFDANSGTNTITFNPSSSPYNCANNIDYTGFTGTMDGAAGKSLRFNGNLTAASGMTWASTGDWTLEPFGSSGTKTIACGTSAGEAGISWDINTQGASYTFTGSLVCNNFTGGVSSSGTINFGSGTFTLNGAFASRAGGMGTFNLNSATFEINAGWNIQVSTIAVDGGTSNITVNKSGAADSFQGGPNGTNSYNNITIHDGASGTFTILNDDFSCATLTINPKSGGRTVHFTDGITVTCTSFVSTATAGNVTTLTRAGTTSAWTISDSAGTNSVEYNTISWSTATGGATWEALTTNGNTDGGNNSGWLFTAVTTLDAAFGTYAVTGSDANLEYHHVVPAAFGVYTLTGLDAGLNKGFTVAANTGSYDITGVDANLEYHHVVDAAFGAYTITGIDANLEYHHVVPAEFGVYTVTGLDATLAITTLIDAAFGAYSVTGVDANLEYHHVIGAEFGTYTITGIDANLEYHRVFPAEFGTYTVTGIDANLEYHPAVAADFGTYTVTGLDADLDYLQIVRADFGSYVVTGIDANLEYHPVVDAAFGAYTVTGIDANLEYHRAVAAAFGTYTITGIDANLEYHRVVDAAFGAYTITGIDATLTYNQTNTLDAEFGLYTVTGIDANTEYHRVINAAFGTYALSGVDATLTYTPVGGPAAENLYTYHNLRGGWGRWATGQGRSGYRR